MFRRRTLNLPAGTSPWGEAWRRLKQDRLAVAGLGVIIFMVFLAMFSPWLAKQSPYEQDLSQSGQPPSHAHWFGTDTYGRDVFSRVIYGSRISMTVGIYSQGLAFLIGITLGAMAGYFGRWVDSLVMWLISVVWSFPALLFIIAVTMALGRGITSVYLAVGAVGWVEVARIVRGQFLSLREVEYVEAAKALGFSPARIMFKHILPNTMAPLIIILTLGFAGAVMAEAGLSFLGLGAQPPLPSWGQMVNEGYMRMISGVAWWMAFFPGIAVMLAVLAFNLLGDGLRDALDPRLR